jgi:hypothetical protein
VRKTINTYSMSLGKMEHGQATEHLEDSCCVCSPVSSTMPRRYTSLCPGVTLSVAVDSHVLEASSAGAMDLRRDDVLSP